MDYAKYTLRSCAVCAKSVRMCTNLNKVERKYGVFLLDPDKDPIEDGAVFQFEAKGLSCEVTKTGANQPQPFIKQLWNTTYTAEFKQVYELGNADDKEGISDSDAVCLLYFTFLPEMYPLH